MKKDSLTYQQIFKLAWPVILANISIPLIGTTNIAALGHLDDAKYLAAVSIGVVVLQSIYWSFAFLRKVTTGLTAQALGAGKTKEIKAILFRNLFFATLLGVVITLLAEPIMTVAFKIIDKKSELETLAKEYVGIRILSSIAVFGNYVILGWLYGLQKNKTALVIRTGMNFINILLCILLVGYCDLKLVGVAWAAVGAQTGFYVLSLMYLWLFNVNGIKDIRLSKFRVFNLNKILMTLNFNKDIFIRSIFVFLAFSWFTFTGANLSTDILSANAVLMNLFWYTSYGLDGFANAAEALIGEAYGSKSVQYFRQAIYKTSITALICAGLLSLIFWFKGKYFISLLTSLTLIQNIAEDYLIWLILMPLSCVICFQLDGIYLGATKTKYMRDMMIVSFLVYSLAIVFLPKVWFNHGLWLALHIFMLARGLTLLINYKKIELK